MPGARASSPPPAICHVGAQASRPHAGSAGFQPASAICPAWVRRRPARMPGARASSPPTTPHLRARASSPPPAICHVGAQASSPHAGSAGFQPASAIRPTWARGRPARMLGARTSSLPQRYAPPGCAGVSSACWVRGRRARMPGARASSLPQRYAPPGYAGFQPACRVHRHCARIQRYTPSPLHRLGAQASRPHAGCTGIAPAYSDTPHHPCTAWVRGRLARMPRAEGHTWQRQWVLDQSLTS